VDDERSLITIHFNSMDLQGSLANVNLILHFVMDFHSATPLWQSSCILSA